MNVPNHCQQDAYFRRRVSLAVLGAAVFLAALPISAGIITTYAGGGGSFTITNGMPATNALLNGVEGLATDLIGNLDLAHFSRAAVRQVNPTNGLLVTVAGTGNFGTSGDNGLATEAGLATPQSLAVDLTGNLYICDPSGGAQGVGSIRKVDVNTGIITTLLDDPTVGDLGGIAVDVHGNLYLADPVYEVVRKWDATNGTLHTIAGSWLSNGHTGDGGPATNALFSFPIKVVVDASDNVFILEQGPPTCVRRIDGVTGIITTIAGGGTGDGASGLATNATLYTNTNGFTAAAQDLAVDNLGALYIGGWSQIWKVDLASASISIIAGVGGATLGFSGDGGPATNALFNQALGLAVSGAGDVYFTDGGNDRVRKVTPDTVPPFQVLVDLTVSQSCLPVQTQVRSNLYLATVNGRLSLVLPNGTNVPGDVIVTNSTSLSAITVPAPAKVGGNFFISAGTNSTSWDLSQLTGVNGSLSLSADGPANFTAGNIMVNGPLTVGAGDGSIVDVGNPSVTGDLVVGIGNGSTVGVGNPTVAGDVTIGTGSGSSVDVGDPTVSGDLAIGAGNGSTVVVSNPNVGGNVQITDGASSTLTFGDATVGGTATLLGGQSNNLQVVAGDYHNSLLITNGDGSVTFIRDAQVRSNVVVDPQSGSTVVFTNNTVDGNVAIRDGSSSTLVFGQSTIGGDFSVATDAQTNVDVSGAEVSGDTTLLMGDATSVSASTAHGRTSVTLSNGPALMQAVLPTGTFTSNVVFTVTSLAAGSLTNVGTGTNATSLSVSPVAAYRFTFAVPAFNQDASLTFDITPAALAPAAQSNFLAALDAGFATVAVLGDALGSTWQTFPVCDSGQSPGADGCVSLVKLDATGTPLPPGSTNAPAVVRFVGVAGHFSTWGVVLVQPAAPPVHLATSLLGDGTLRLSWTGPATGVLETSTNLAPNSWSPAGPPTQQPDGSWRLDVAPTEPARFYRFRSP